jgi:hypothetical protein
MQNAKNKTMATLIALFLMSAMAISLVALPNANAQATSGTKETYALMGATPNPVGVGQQTLLDVGITDAVANVTLGWTGITVTVTKPDGTTETLGPVKTDATGMTGIVYTPTTVGNYTLQSHFPQQISPGGMVAAGIIMLASDSEKLTLVVQQQPILFYPGVPLPTEYWTRPIDSQAREWYSISESWLTTGAGTSAPAGMLVPNNAGPETAHVLWTKPLTTGGLVGGDLGLVGSGATSVGMETGDAYEGKWTVRLILMGRLYYNTGAYDRPNLIHCVDLHTGQELWAKTFLDNRSIALGQLFYWQSYNYMGTYAYLWVTVGTTWTAFDAFTGNWMATITNVPSGTNVVGPRGEIYRYTANLAAGWMALWNMSALVSMDGSWGSAFELHAYDASTGTVQTVATDGTLNPVSYTASANATAAAAAARAWSWNITIPRGLRGSIVAINWTDGRVVGANVNTTDVNIWAFCIPPIGRESPIPGPTPAGSPGTLLYNNDWKAPADWAAGNQTISWMISSFDDKVGVVWSKETRQYYGFSLATGAFLWGPSTPPQSYLDEFAAIAPRSIAYGRLYSAGMGGIVYCYNVTTGKLLWTYSARDSYTEALFSDNWWIEMAFITDGKIYLTHKEHSPNQPLPRGAPLICLNATTGDVIWRVNGLIHGTVWGGNEVIGDSIIATMDEYTQRVYAIGKGPSATTVEAPMTAITAGDNVVIQGTVTDISPGTEDYALKARFPNGVPAVSDASQGDWMLYVYKQFPRPTNATGVTVSIDAVDPNSNFVHLGTATSDSNGLFTYEWKTPTIPGKYTVIATFAGSGAYYASYAETGMAVSEAPAVTPAPAYPVPIDYTPTIVAVAVVLLIAIAIVGILVIRKK